MKLSLTEYKNTTTAGHWIECIANEYLGNPNCSFSDFKVDVSKITFFKISKNGLNVVFWDSSGKERYFEIAMIGTITNDGAAPIANPTKEQVYDFFSITKGFI